MPRRGFGPDDSTDEVAELDSHPLLSGLKRLIVGGGSNLLFVSDFDGSSSRSICAGCAKSVKPLTPVDRGGSGENWHATVETLLANDRPDWRTRIDSRQVGAAPIQNIGAYGLELAERFNSLVAWDFDHTHRELALTSAISAIATASSRRISPAAA